MEILVAQGKILYVGSSNFGGWHLAQAQAAAAERNFMGLVSEQSIYNLVVRDIEREIIPAAPIVGPRTQEHLDSTMRALAIELTQEHLTKLNEIFPGYKTSPEDHAW